MHLDTPAVPPADTTDRPWYKELTRYHWFVFAVAAGGWLADCMDQQLFNLARDPAIAELRGTRENLQFYGGLATMIFMFGWASGGMIFGIMGDRWGRAKTMLLTIFLYSLFTGLSAMSVGVWDFAFYRFLTGLGVGGEFAVGVALLAETMPDRARSYALGWLQASSTLGNISAALIGLTLAKLEQFDWLGDWKPWRYEFIVGAAPALMVVFFGRRLKEPERWKAMHDNLKPGQKIGSMVELLTTPVLRRNALVGLVLATSGVVGLWAIGFFGFGLTRNVFRVLLQNEGLTSRELDASLTWWTSIYGLMFNSGAFLGIYAFSRFTHGVGRKPAFAVAFIAALLSTAFTFLNLNSIADIFWMVPVMGFCQLSLFCGYAIYFPELFPTRLRSTGTSFCYNVGRYLAAPGPLLLGTLASMLYGDVFHLDEVESLRYAGVTMCAFFLLGLAVLPFAPETRGQPLPE